MLTATRANYVPAPGDADVGPFAGNPAKLPPNDQAAQVFEPSQREHDWLERHRRRQQEPDSCRHVWRQIEPSDFTTKRPFKPYCPNCRYVQYYSDLFRVCHCRTEMSSCR